MKKFLALLLTMCVVLGCAEAVGEDIPAYGIKSVTQTQYLSTRYPGMGEEPEITCGGSRFVYHENGLAENYAEWSDSRGQVLTFAVEDGELRMKESWKMKPASGIWQWNTNCCMSLTGRGTPAP